MKALQREHADMRQRRLALYHGALTAVVIVGLAYVVALHRWAASDVELLFWVLVIAAAELMPVQGWGSTQLTMSLPLVMAVLLLFPPETAAAVVFIASADPREFRREIPLLKALFNRSQTALSAYLAGATFHVISTLEADWVELVLATLAATAVYEVANATFVAIALGLERDVPLTQLYRQLAGGSLLEFLFFYIGLGLLGIPLARLYAEVPSGEWAIVFFMLPLLLARQMFSRSQALQHATEELREREKVLRTLSSRMAEERYDERKQIAAYLHDDLAQMLFRLGLQADTARSQLERGDQERAMQALNNVEDIKDDSVKLVRGLIRDLDRSPIGPAGLATALSTLANDLSQDGQVRFQVEVSDIELSAPIQLLAYQIAREAAQNAVKHADATNVWISLVPEGDQPTLRIRDDGKGFDTSAPPPEGHYGLSIMRERAQLAGGTFEIVSGPGQGTQVTVRFLSSWIDDGQAGAVAPSTQR